MTERTIVDVTEVVLRLQCKCGSAVTITPTKIVRDKPPTDAIYLCPNCEKVFPGYGKSATGPVSKFVEALDALATAELEGCRVQFEIDRPPT